MTENGGLEYEIDADANEFPKHSGPNQIQTARAPSNPRSPFAPHRRRARLRRDRILLPPISPSPS
jgi:hypothetical protein